ncbi:MAG TPA: hypothetical protein PLE71_17230, partial [Flavobacteriales bacterium]|nr:hypothetical protein [Flavobacteriales bacterium]
MNATQEAPVTEGQSDFLSVITGENRAQPVADPVADPVGEDGVEGVDGADPSKGVNDTTEPAAPEVGKEEEAVKETTDTKAEGEGKEEAKEVDPLDAYISGTDP